eukprot:gene11322-biopygen12402
MQGPPEPCDEAEGGRPGQRRVGGREAGPAGGGGRAGRRRMAGGRRASTERMRQPGGHCEAGPCVLTVWIFADTSFAGPGNQGVRLKRVVRPCLSPAEQCRPLRPTVGRPQWAAGQRRRSRAELPAGQSAQASAWGSSSAAARGAAGWGRDGVGGCTYLPPFLPVHRVAVQLLLLRRRPGTQGEQDKPAPRPRRLVARATPGVLSPPPPQLLTPTGADAGRPGRRGLCGPGRRSALFRLLRPPPPPPPQQQRLSGVPQQGSLHFVRSLRPGRGQVRFPGRRASKPVESQWSGTGQFHGTIPVAFHGTSTGHSTGKTCCPR